MDGTITWMLVLAGATVALLGAFLVVSEKELRKKRREVASLAAKLSRPNTDLVSGDYQNNLAKLENANKELQEQLSALSIRLQSAGHEVAQLETEKRQLEVSNQKLNDDAVALRQQLNSVTLANEEYHIERAAFDDQLASIGNELKSTSAKLEQAETRIEELENVGVPSAPSTSERSLIESRTEFEISLKALQRELADNVDKLQAFDSVKRQLVDLEQKYDTALLENRQLQQEITRWQERVPDNEAAQPDFGVIREINDSPLQSDMADDQAQMQFDMVGLLEKRSSSRQAMHPGVVLRSAASPGLSGMDGLETHEQTSAFQASIEYVEATRDESNLPGVDLELRPSPDSRTARLAHLLAWIRLHGSETYREQIDSLKDFTDLSERERHVVRDIFLARADEAQKRGRDDEMLRYRSWAKNIVYHTRFADDEIEDVSEIRTIENQRRFEASSDRSAIDTVPATTVKPSLTTVQREGIKSPAGNVALGIGVGLGLVLILLVQLFFDTSAEITVASDDASPAASSRPVELPTRRQPIEENRSPIIAENTPDIEAPRPEERVSAKPDGAKAAARNSPKEPPTKTTRSQSLFGAHTIVKATPVYSEPSEESALITSLDPGTQVNVVATRRGWYEIRSRSGRPPGFIRQDVASRNR
ncbi:MAG TPA: SH3 domain-containing protein [Candidatus Binatia bacterium]